MENIRLKINKLGRIRNSEIELTQWMIFSGESGMGKSYLATLVHYFFDVLLDSNRVDAFFTEKRIVYNALVHTFHNEGIAFSIRKKDLEEWMAIDAIKYVSYMINDKDLSADVKVILPDVIPETIQCTFKEEIMGMENDVETYIKYVLPQLTYTLKNAEVGLNAESPFAYFFRYYLIKALFGDYSALKHTFVMPPSRGAVMTEKVEPISGMFKKFIADKIYLESAKSETTASVLNLSPLMNEILEGRVNLAENKQYKYVMNGSENVEMPLSAAASSVRELAPIQMLFDNVDINKTALLFEEPEAHLHPEKQRKMADVLSCMSALGMIMQITTHSDYLLRRLNELISIVRLKQKSTKLYNMLMQQIGIGEGILPNIDALSAYLLERQQDGTSVIIKQDLDRGIPYSSFFKPLKESIEMKELIARLEKIGNEDSRINKADF